MTENPLTTFSSANIKIGHAQDGEAHTGCSVFLLPEGTVVSADFRGSAPGSREAALLQPTKPIATVNAIVMTGGSALGLVSAEGVMTHLAEQNIGHPTPIRNIPLVGAAVIYDLFFSGGKVLPDMQMGKMAAESAKVDNPLQGNVGVGAGATVGKWGGFPGFMKGGFGLASHREGDLSLFAAVVVNAVGDVVAENGDILAGAVDENNQFRAHSNRFRLFSSQSTTNITNTSLVFIGCNARLDKVSCYRVAARAHDGLAQAIRPIHTRHDGDAAFCAATQVVDADEDWVANISAELVAQAVRNAVKHAKSIGSIRGLG